MLARFFRHFWCAYWQAARLFPADAQRRLADAIGRAEQGHAGEICVVVEASLTPLQIWRGMGPRERALEVFAQQRVWDTAANSGVLVYLLLADHAVEIVADRGLGPADDPAWTRAATTFREAFRSGRVAAGCTAAIDDIGAELRRRFPSSGPNPDELSNPVRLL
ncbi:MAG: TPM domain-containing protein [Burkholderiaceae bacterium]|nr:TPM domain-containing protein [Burkholderiaceae bacterium]